MRLSKTSAQAALAVAFLAEQTGPGPTQARQVAEYLRIPTDSALKILQALVRNRIIKSQLGRAGGYRMHRDAQTISLLEIIEALDGPVTGDAALHHHGGGEDDSLTSRVDLLTEICDRAAARIRNEISRYTVADVASGTISAFQMEMTDHAPLTGTTNTHKFAVAG